MKRIPGFSNYLVSDTGEVFSTLVHTRNPRGELRQIFGYLHSHGYCIISLISDEGVKKKVSIHQLVLLTFVGPKPPKLGACHRDDNKLNNRLDNLYWGSQSDNMKDAVLNGTHSTLKYDESVIDSIRDLHRLGHTSAIIADLTGVSASHVRSVVRGVHRGTFR